MQQLESCRPCMGLFGLGRVLACLNGLQCDVIAPEPSPSPTAGLARPCVVMWLAVLPSPTSSTSPQPFGVAIFSLMSSNPIAPYDPAGPVGGFSHCRPGGSIERVLSLLRVLICAGVKKNYKTQPTRPLTPHTLELLTRWRDHCFLLVSVQIQRHLFFLLSTDTSRI